MEFRLPKADLLRALRLAAAVADRKSTMPLLGHVLLRTSKHTQMTLLVAATDLAVSVSCELQLTEPAKSDGALALPAKSLYELVANAPGDDIRIKRLDGNWAEVFSGKAKYKLAGLADRDFPKLPDRREVADGITPIGAPLLVRLIDRTLFSVCHDETRLQLNGVYFHRDGDKLIAVSTDGHRLTLASAGIPLPLTKGIIVPRKGLVEVKRLLADATTCQLAVTASTLFVVAGGTALAVKLIDAQFPPYQQVIPKLDAKTTRVTVDRGRLIESLRRMQLMTTDQHGVKLSPIDGGIRVEAAHADMGNVTEGIDCEVSGTMPTIGFSPKYAVELLTAMTADSVTLCVGGELDPVLVQQPTDDSHSGVVMPMRV